MKEKICMGNDEFILYIRKQSTNRTITNDHLGRLIWEWLREKGASKKQEQPQPTYWTKSEKVNEYMLPEYATQFEFDRGLLPVLYDYLDELAKR